MSNPTQEQVAFAYSVYLKQRNGDATLAMDDLKTFIIGYSAPPAASLAQPEMVLSGPAMVGNTIFSSGQPWFAVVQRAMEEFTQRDEPQPSALRIAEFREWLEQGQPVQQFEPTP